MSYHQFTRDERFCLWELLNSGMSIRSVADAMGRSPSSISRELKRNSSSKGYHPIPAHKKARVRKKMLRSSSLQTDPELKDYVISRLKLYWPPSTIKVSPLSSMARH